MHDQWGNSWPQLPLQQLLPWHLGDLAQVVCIVPVLSPYWKLWQRIELLVVSRFHHVLAADRTSSERRFSKAQHWHRRIPWALERTLQLQWLLLSSCTDLHHSPSGLLSKFCSSAIARSCAISSSEHGATQCPVGLYTLVKLWKISVCFMLFYHILSHPMVLWNTMIIWRHEMKQLSWYSADLSEFFLRNWHISLNWQRPSICCHSKWTCLDIWKCSDIGKVTGSNKKINGFTSHPSLRQKSTVYRYRICAL